MIGHSPKFAQSIRSSHKFAVRARACTVGQSGGDPDGVEIPIVSGDVRLDVGSPVLSTLDMTTVADWPRRADSLLNVYATEVFVERGITYADGSTELLPLGYHRLETVEQDATVNAPRGAIRLAASDRMAKLRAARFLKPQTFGKNRSFGDVIDELVLEVYPTAVIEWDDNQLSRDLGRKMTTQKDRHAFIDDLVVSLGKVWYFDHLGVLRIEDIPDPSVPVDVMDAGDGGVLVSARRQLSTTGVYNAVQAVGEGADTQDPPHAIIYDISRGSPTNWNGPFGRVPKRISLPSITTTGQAGAAARAELQKVVGLPYSVDFTAVPNPALRPRDPVRVFYGHDAAPETHVIDTLSVPLTYDGTFAAQTREQTELVFGSD